MNKLTEDKTLKKSEQIKSGPSKSGPSKSGPSKSGPSKSVPSKSGPSKSVPSKSGPSKSGPSKSVPSKSVPSKSKQEDPWKNPMKSTPGTPKKRATRGANKDTKKKSNKKKIYIISFIICLALLAYSGYKVYETYMEYEQGDATNVETLTLAMGSEPIEIDTYWEADIDFTALKSINDDVIGWIHFPEPSIISYAIMETSDNNYYLTHTINKEYSIFGSIFADMDNSIDFSDGNTILYGHNMKNGSMFGSLSDYKSETYYKDNKYFYLYTADGMAAKFQVAAVQEVAADSWHYQRKVGNLAERTEFLEKITAGSLYDTQVEVENGIQFLTLSTCTSNDSKRLIVQGLKLEEREMVKN